MGLSISMKESLVRLRSNGFVPTTVFDIGVATGTPGLYSIFENVRYVLVDPLTESEPFMAKICERFPNSFYRVAAAGAAQGEAPFVVEPGLSGSSFLMKGGTLPVRNVPVVTLDSLVDEHDLKGPFLVKLDVQGFELEVLRGLVRHLDKTEIVIAETSLWADRKRSGAPTTAELIAFMSDRGFVLYDIAGIAYRPRDGAIAEMDLLFCRADSSLRAHASYRTPEQKAERLAQKKAKFERAEPRL
jgi:FkbM family methyltransferase